MNFNPFRKSKNKSVDIDYEANTKIFDFLERNAGIRIDKISDYNSYFDSVLGNVWASWKACDMVSSVVASTMWKLIDERSGLDKRDDELMRMLTHPNTHETFKELLYLTAMQLKMVGNAYWYKDTKTLGGSFDIIPLYPQYVKIIPDPKKKIGNFEYTRNGHTTYYLPEQIIHFKRPNPADPVLGIGDIEASETLFQDYINQVAIRTKGLERGNIPAGVLVRDEFEGDEVEWERAKNAWEKKYVSKGRGQGSIAWLTGKWSFLKLGQNAQETEALEYEKKTEREIFLAHGVPASIAGFENATNYATARQDYINFTRFTCLPIVDLIFSRLNDPDEFVKKRNERYFLEYSLDGLLDVEQMVRDYKPLVECGAMSLNELRQKCGLKTTNNPDHDLYYATSSTVTLEDVSNPVEDEIEEIEIEEEESVIAEDDAEEEIEEEIEDEEDAEGTRIYGTKVDSVPSYVSGNARRGLELRGKYGGGGLTPKLIREARLMGRGEISNSKAIRMSAWLSRHESDLESPKAKAYLRGETDRPTAGQITWLLWGGDLDEGNRMRVQKWAERQAKRIRDEDKGGKIVEIQSMKSKSWKFGEGLYDIRARNNARRALAYLDTHKPLWSNLKVFADMYSIPELRGMASVLSRKTNLSYKSLCKIANACKVGERALEKAEDDPYENVDSLLIDLLGGVGFIRWASEEVGEID